MDDSGGSSRPEHNYPPTLQQLLVNMTNGIGKGGNVTPISAKRVVQFQGAPSLSTLELWRNKKRISTELDSRPTKIGRPTKVPEPESLITGGWTLRQLEKGKIVTGERVVGFMKV